MGLNPASNLDRAWWLINPIGSASLFLFLSVSLFFSVSLSCSPCLEIFLRLVALGISKVELEMHENRHYLLD